MARLLNHLLVALAAIDGLVLEEGDEDGFTAAVVDSAAMESFFALLQKNVLDRQRWATRDDLRIAIVTWIERTYNRRRRQPRLGRLAPIQYETIMTPQTATAA